MRFSFLLLLVALLSLGACQVKQNTREAASAPLPQPVPAVADRAGGNDPERLPEQASFLDSDSQGTAALQKADEAMRTFPVDRYGFVDWAATLKKGLIAPRNVVQGGEEVRPLDLDILMRNTREMPHVMFPHRVHTEWLACGSCHPALFAEKAGSTRILMDDIFRGEHCGVCHGKVAFPTYYTCERCHSVPHGEGKAWWK